GSSEATAASSGEAVGCGVGSGAGRKNAFQSLGAGGVHGAGSGSSMVISVTPRRVSSGSASRCDGSRRAARFDLSCSHQVEHPAADALESDAAVLVLDAAGVGSDAHLQVPDRLDRALLLGLVHLGDLLPGAERLAELVADEALALALLEPPRPSGRDH